jgi:hypothetical protein
MIAQQNILTGEHMPADLRLLACQILGGTLTRPNARGRKRLDNWHRDYLVLTLLEELVERFDVYPTRNEATALEHSACDIVAWAFEEAGDSSFTYKNVREIWFNKALRDEIRAIRNIRARENKDEPPAFVGLGEAPFPVSEK